MRICIVPLAVPALIALSLAGCRGKSDQPVPEPGLKVASAALRITSPQIAPDDFAAMVAGQQAFATEFYRQVRTSADNVVFSPYSISSVLAMVYAGAESATHDQMTTALHFAPSDAALHPAFDQIDLALSSRPQASTGPGHDVPLQLQVLNRLWGQTGFEILPGFLDTLAENYGAGVNLLDFISQPEVSRTAINDWVADQTAGRIPDLIPEGAIDANIRLVLTNVVYLKARWEYPFNKNTTSSSEFTRRDGTTTTVPFMNQQSDHPYGEGADYQAVELAYQGGELAMTIIVPKSGQLDAFETSLDASRLNSIINGLAASRVQLSLPRFTVSWNDNLNDALRALGMVNAFDASAADFSGITLQDKLYIAWVVHKAFIAVDEDGTEAAAATAAGASATSLPPPPDAALSVDRPFFFVLRDRPTGVILFLGRIDDPSQVPQ